MYIFFATVSIKWVLLTITVCVVVPSSSYVVMFILAGRISQYLYALSLCIISARIMWRFFVAWLQEQLCFLLHLGHGARWTVLQNLEKLVIDITHLKSNTSFHLSDLQELWKDTVLLGRGLPIATSNNHAFSKSCFVWQCLGISFRPFLGIVFIYKPWDTNGGWTIQFHPLALNNWYTIAHVVLLLYLLEWRLKR